MPKIETDRLSGTQYVRLANLSEKQAGSLLEWLPESFLTKAGDSEHTEGYCVEYEDYEFWLEHFYKNADSQPEEEI